MRNLEKKQCLFSAARQVGVVDHVQGATLLPTIAIEAGLREAHSSVVVPIAGQTKLARSDLFVVGNHLAHPQSGNSGFICETN